MALGYDGFLSWTLHSTLGGQRPNEAPHLLWEWQTICYTTWLVFQQERVPLLLNDSNHLSRFSLYVSSGEAQVLENDTRLAVHSPQ